MKTYLTTLNLSTPQARPEDTEPKETVVQAVQHLARDEAKLIKDYFHDPKNAEIFSLQAGSYVATGGALLASGMPVLGNVLNAVNAVADTATLLERIRAHRAGNPMATSSDIAADATAVALDVAGIFFPPVQWPGQALVSAWDARQTYLYLSRRPTETQ